MKTNSLRNGCLWLSLLLALAPLGACGLISGFINFDGSVEIPECAEDDKACKESEIEAE